MRRRVSRSLIGVCAAGFAGIAVLSMSTAAVAAASISGNAWAWGPNIAGQVGDGTTLERDSPVRVHLPPGVHFVAAAVGGGFDVALDDQGGRWAWGDLLGNGTNAGITVPIHITLPRGVTFTHVAAGDSFAVALDANGQAWEWGFDNNASSAFGPSSNNSDVPVRVRMPRGVSFTSVAAAPYGLVAALDASGQAWTWGDNSQRELGDGGTEASSGTPVRVRMPAGVRFTSVAPGAAGGGTGLQFMVALDQSGDAWAWGNNQVGEVGIGTTCAFTPLGCTASPVPLPSRVHMPAGVTFTQISAGGGFVEAVDSSGRVWGWGSNGGGFLGVGPAGAPGAGPGLGGGAADVPTRAALPAGVRFTQVAAGNDYTMALDSQGHAWAWGGQAGSLGAGSSLRSSPSPVRVAAAAGVQFSELVSGPAAADALALTGTLLPPSQGTPLSTISTSLLSPWDAFKPVQTIVVSTAIAAGAVLFLTFPSNMFNLTFQENYAEIRAWWVRRVRALRRRRRDAGGTPASPARSWLGTPLLSFIVVVLVGALLASLNDPTFGFRAGSLATYIGTACAITAGVVVTALVTAAYHRRRHGSAPLSLRALPAGLAVAAGCVLVSRLSGFQPGYLYGVICGVVFARELPKHEKGHVVALTTLATLAVALGAWFAWVPINQSATQAGASFGIVALDDFLAAVFVTGLVGSVISLLPLRFLPGWTLKEWRREAWGAIFGIAFLLLVQVMLRPHSSRPSAAPLVTTIVLFVVFGALSVGFREYFARRRRAATGEPAPDLRGRLRELMTPMTASLQTDGAAADGAGVDGAGVDGAAPPVETTAVTPRTED